MGRKQLEKPDYYTQREWNRIRAREKAQARASRNLVLVTILMLVIAAVLICSVWFFSLRSHDAGLRMPYDVESPVFGIHNGGDMMVKAVPFADGLCVTETDVDADAIRMLNMNAEELRRCSHDPAAFGLRHFFQKVFSR